ncbi:hypothetical protein AEAC466_13355 [Asticcacaulis sp. AC466]|uniref:alpha/beta hydrolase n=1 Tax=Asticcacaulis sp. AC466 TaxID=1282362 RepID=UPI0003C3BABA|nr:alpha/beta hydrolase-fold protein [Asticcacaulis sp. AC466]ESQ83233.1 hypothetical protein AEAC466_13355 [Asticcacaulis sp. AC466]
MRAMIAATVLAGTLACTSSAYAEVQFKVEVPATAEAPVSGRLLIFATKAKPGEPAPTEVDTSPFEPTGTAIAAREINTAAPGQTIVVDADTDAFPSAFSDLPPGQYYVQAVLDRNHDYNYGGRGAGDRVSPVVSANLPGDAPLLTLSDLVPERSDDDVLKRLPPDQAQAVRASLAGVRAIDFVSPALSAFRGTPTHIRGWVALPPGYPKAGQTYPTVYTTSGFGATLASQKFAAARMAAMMASGDIPPMIWVFLDQSLPTGAHEFADSVNNGPWGTALTTELIPWIETQYATDAKPSSRFLTGHSSGGWTSLWLQVRYPTVFGGTWPTSPDSSDFSDFTNADLYRPDANVYTDADGKPVPLVRDHGKVLATFKDFARLEQALGAYGGQMASFDWVFSPKGADGKPVPMFDRATGKVDPAVAAYWRAHWDIAQIVARDWPRLKPDLDGKIHLYVGTADTFYLDGAAHKLKAVFDGLGAHEDFTFVPDKTHFDLYANGNDRTALLKTIAWQMYLTARPDAKRP